MRNRLLLCMLAGGESVGRRREVGRSVFASLIALNSLMPDLMERYVRAEREYARVKINVYGVEWTLSWCRARVVTDSDWRAPSVSFEFQHA